MGGVAARQPVLRGPDVPLVFARLAVVAVFDESHEGEGGHFLGRGGALVFAGVP